MKYCRILLVEKKCNTLEDKLKDCKGIKKKLDKVVLTHNKLWDKYGRVLPKCNVLIVKSSMSDKLKEKIKILEEDNIKIQIKIL